MKIAVVMNYDSYERFGFTDPRDDLNYLKLEYELYTEHNIEHLFVDTNKYSCLLLASNCLHHPVIQNRIKEKIQLLYDAVRNGMGLVIFHQSRKEDFSAFQDLLVGAMIRSESTLEAFAKKNHPILPSFEGSDDDNLSITEDRIFQSYYLYYLCFDKLPEHFEAIAENKNHRHVLIAREYGRGRIVITTGALDWYSANMKLINSILIWAAGSGDIVVFPGFQDFLSGLSYIEHRISEKPADIGKPKILVTVNDEANGIIAPITIAINDGIITVRSDGTIIKTRLLHLLEATLLENGSWENSIWKTAEAIEALHLVANGDYVGTNGDYGGIIRRGISFIKGNIENAQQPLVVANTIRVLTSLSEMPDVNLSGLFDDLSKSLLTDEAILKLDIMPQIKVVRNLVGIRTKAQIHKLMQNWQIGDRKLDNLPVDVLSDMLFVAKNSDKLEIAGSAEKRILENGDPKRYTGYTDDYVRLRFLYNMIQLGYEQEFLRSELLRTISKTLTGTQPSYLISLTIKAFVIGLSIPYYREQILALDVMNIMIQGGLVVSAWPDIEPKLKSLEKELQQVKNNVRLLENEKGVMLLDRKAKESEIEKKESEIEKLNKESEAIFVQITKKQAQILGGIGAAVTFLITVLSLVFGIIR